MYVCGGDICDPVRQLESWLPAHSLTLQGSIHAEGTFISQWRKQSGIQIGLKFVPRPVDRAALDVHDQDGPRVGRSTGVLIRMSGRLDARDSYATYIQRFLSLLSSVALNACSETEKLTTHGIGTGISSNTAFSCRKMSRLAVNMPIAANTWETEALGKKYHCGSDTSDNRCIR